MTKSGLTVFIFIAIFNLFGISQDTAKVFSKNNGIGFFYSRLPSINSLNREFHHSIVNSSGNYRYGVCYKRTILRSNKFAINIGTGFSYGQFKYEHVRNESSSFLDDTHYVRLYKVFQNDIFLSLVYKVCQFKRKACYVHTKLVNSGIYQTRNEILNLNSGKKTKSNRSELNRFPSNSFSKEFSSTAIELGLSSEIILWNDIVIQPVISVDYYFINDKYYFGEFSTNEFGCEFSLIYKF